MDFVGLEADSLESNDQCSGQKALYPWLLREMPPRPEGPFERFPPLYPQRWQFLQSLSHPLCIQLLHLEQWLGLPIHPSLLEV
ncbi:hypothetical protein FKM82_008954 [Ascaphus truei]